MALTPAALPPAQAGSARDRLLAAASDLFYSEGIHSTGVDRVITEAGVTRATFYRHFPSKEDLVVAYVQAQDDAIRERAAAATAALGQDHAAVLDAIVAGVADQLLGPRFRGCPYVNTAAEYPDPASPVRLVIDAHRCWFHDAVLKLLTDSGHDAPLFAADLLVVLRDGAQVGAYLGDPEAVRATFLRAAEGVLGRPLGSVIEG